MKNRLILIGCAVCFCLPVSVAEEETPLGKQMEAFDDAYKGFRRETDPVKGAAATREAQAAVIKSLAELPEMLKKMPAGPAREKSAAGYRKMMGEVYVLLCKAELAFLSGKTEDVAGIVGELKKLKKAGHGEFMEDD